MSDSKTSPGSGANKTQKRNLPSWMSSRQEVSKLHGKNQNDESDEVEKKTKLDERPAEHRRNGSFKETEHGKMSAASCSSSTRFSKLMEGVVFVLSGFVNPERSMLRSQALEMGAEYQPDWSSDCTLLVCAFPNTPKYRQVQADCGTIVSKEWISECYTQKKLVDIEQYLMHPGKPWRKSNISNFTGQDKKGSPPEKSQKQVDKGTEAKSTVSVSSKSRASNLVKDWFSLPEMKKWALEDLNQTISWLESQEEKPEPSQIKHIAKEGILTCLQDAINSLEQMQDVCLLTEQWNFIPRIVEELVKIEGTKNDSTSFLKEDLCRQAKACKKIYEEELGKLGDDLPAKKKKPKTDESRNNGRSKAISNDAAGYDSDETIEMTEEEIDTAYKTMASKFVNDK